MEVEAEVSLYPLGKPQVYALLASIHRGIRNLRR